jgi:hypothetical protein
MLACYFVVAVGEQKRTHKIAGMEEGRKRVLAIVAGILVARHLNNVEPKCQSLRINEKRQPQAEQNQPALLWQHGRPAQ